MIPDEMKERNQWLLWSSGSDPPKAPLTADGYLASWTDPGVWMSYEEASKRVEESSEFDGVGFVIAEQDPYIGLDIDGALEEHNEEQPKDWVPGLGFVAGTWAEYSTSGLGIHIITEGERLPDWWSDEHFTDAEHEGVEAYTEKFFALTGDKVDFADTEIRDIDIEPFLSEAYEAVTGEPPQLPGADDRPDADVDVGIYDVISQGSYPEEENASHPFHPSDSGTNFRVDRGGGTFRCWRHGVTGNGLHLLGIEQDVIECGDWAGSGLSSDTWREIFDAGREAGYDIPKPQAPDGGETATRSADGPTEPDASESDLQWVSVIELYQSTDSGTTTKANNIAADLIDEEFDLRPIRDTGIIYFYDEQRGFYVRKGRRYLEQIIQDKLNGEWNVNRARNVRKNVIARNWVSGEKFKPPEGKVCVKNGVLDLDSRELESHSPDYYFTAQLNVEYDPDAECDRWREFLDDVTTQSGEADKIEEFIGYTLQVWKHDRHKNLFIVGPTQSGKSTLAEVVAGLFGGPPTVVNLTPQQIADTRFDAASLSDAMLNTVNDINASKIENSGALKRVFAGEPLKLESKHKDASFGAPKTKHLFTANWLPPVVGEDEAVWRRLLIVEFPDSVPRAERIKGLGQELLTELPGILNRALDALDRLEEQDGFTNDRARDRTRRVWDSWRDAHKRYLYTQFDVTGDDDNSVAKDTYYQAYKEFAAREGYEIKPKQSITKSLKWVPEIAVQDDAYHGISWRDEDAAEAKQSRLSQSSLKKEVLNWVDEFSDPINAAKTEDIMEYADGMNYDDERIEYTIEELLKDGRLMESGDGVRIT